MKRELPFIEERKRLWIALSELYIDNELQDSDIKMIAEAILGSPFTIEEVYKINRDEVFPVVKWNLLSVAGIWSGFNEVWLVTAISKRLRRNNIIARFGNRIMFQWLKGHIREDWKRVEAFLE